MQGPSFRPSSRRLRRNSRMRSVMALSQQGSIGRASAPVDRSGGEPPGLSGEESSLSPVRWRHERVDGLFAREAAFVWKGETPTARWARWTSLFGVDLWRAD